MQVVAEWGRLPQAALYAIRADGTLASEINDTFLTMISELDEPLLKQLEALAIQAAAGAYASVEPEKTDFGVNCTSVALLPPRARPGFVVGYNDYIDGLAADEAGAELSIETFVAIVQFWRQFLVEVLAREPERRIGMRSSLAL